MVSENHINVVDLIYPVFVTEGQNQSIPIPSMPGVTQKSIDLLIEDIKIAADLGIPAIALFPVTPTDKKTNNGAESYNADNLVCTAIQAIKKAVPNVGIITDVALDPYTTHGHDGIIDDNGTVLNDETLEILNKQAIIQAQAGADIIAPSDMMDGRVGAIRTALDNIDMTHTMILAYAAKYASAFYGPFRDAVHSSGCLTGDKKTYQMNPANSAEGIHEVAMDINEGADMVMVKPGLPYLDMVTRIKNTFDIPTFAYHVSGEYAMLKAASQNGWLDYDQSIMETVISFKRAGTDCILTYAACDVARLIKTQKH